MQIQFVEGLRDPKQIIVGIVIIWAIGLICSIVTWIATKEKETTVALSIYNIVVCGLFTAFLWKHWTIVEVYEHHVLMKSEQGYHESFSNTDIRELIREGEIRWR